MTNKKSHDDQHVHDDQPPEHEQSNQPEVPQEDNDLFADMQQQIADLTDALQRERADATNIRRRHDEQIASLKNVIKASVVRDLLPIADNLERALKHTPVWDNGKQSNSSTNEDQAKAWVQWAQGIQGVVKQFEKTLSNIGVERIKTVGEPFDPTYHEAVTMEEGDGTQEVVSDELQAGYKLGDEVIRHAMVKVKTQ